MMRLLIMLFGCIILLIAEAQADGLEIEVKGKKQFLPYWEAQYKTSYGALLIISGSGAKDGLILMTRLGKRLSRLGWSVVLLSINESQDQSGWTTQLPVVLSALRQRNNNNLVVLHYGAKLYSLLDYFAKLQQINGLILLSAFEEEKPKDTSGLIADIRFPVFDLVGQFDYGRVIEQAKVRFKVKPNKKYSQIKFPGAAHDYCYTRKILAAYIHGWMKNLAPRETLNGLSVDSTKRFAGPPVLRN